MPTYQYRCTNCEEDLEVVQSFSDDPLDRVPHVWGAAAEGVLARRHRLQGHRVLQDRQPGWEERVGQTQGEGEGDELVVLLIVVRLFVLEVRLVIGFLFGRLQARHLLEEGQQDRRDRGGLGPGRDRRLRRLRLLLLSRRRDRGRPSTRPTGRRRRPSPSATSGAGGWPSCPATAPPRAAAPPHQLPGQPVGHAGARRHPAASGPAPPARCSPPWRRATSSSPTSSSTARGAGPTPSTRARWPTTSPSPTPTAPSCGRWRGGGPGGGHHRPPDRHGRRGPGAPVLDPGRVPLVPAARAGRSST